MENKVCRICKKELSVECFPKTRGYLRGECWECFRRINNERAQKNRKNVSERVKTWRKANPEKWHAIAKRSRLKRNNAVESEGTEKWRMSKVGPDLYQLRYGTRKEDDYNG